MKRTVHNIYLPPDFAQRLLDNQIQFKLAVEPSKQVISNLIELYTYGVEYYEAIRSYKYLYFQKKMNELFTGGTALQIMNKKTGEEELTQSPVQKKMKNKRQEQKIQAFKIKEKHQKMLSQIIQKTSYSITSVQTKHIIKDTQAKQISAQKVINQQLQTQMRSLEQKLKQRKARKLVTKSMSSIQLFQTLTRDSLFDTDCNDTKKTPTSPYRGTVTREPIQFNFQSLIYQNDQSQEDEEQSNRKRKQSGFSCKRVMSTDDLHGVKDKI